MTRAELRARYRSLNAAEWAAGDEVIRVFHEGGSFRDVVRQLEVLRIQRLKLVREAHEAALELHEEVRRAAN